MSTFVRKVTLGLAVAGLSVVSSVGAFSQSASATSAHAKVVKVKGGTAYFAEQPGSAPTYIFPFINQSVFTNVNLYNFQILMFRNLYFFGNGAKAQINYKQSLAYAPVFSNGDKTITIKMKGWKWSDGSTVDARDLIFWMNLLKANKTIWASYTPGAFPDNVASYKQTGPETVVFQLTKAYNPNWFLYNELSQLVPIPMAWDKTSATSPTPSETSTTAPDLTPAGAVAVYKYLNAQSSDLNTYGTNPLWKVVDGPWVLQSFTTLGKAVFTPNPSYSGPVKPTLSKFVELPFSSDAAEYNVLQQGNQLTYGYIPVADLPQKSRIASEGYNFAPWLLFGFDYMSINFNNPTVGPIFQQLYARQALEDLVDQPAWIKTFWKGLAVPTHGPVPTAPSNPFADSVSKQGAYSYSVATARKLLTSHGWKIPSSGAAFCAKPGSGSSQCGTGVQKNQKFAISLQYLSGLAAVAQEMQAYKSAASSAGIQISLSVAPFNSVISNATPCVSTAPSCKWEVANWGGGWSYSPDYYPSGESLFAQGAGANFGSYNNATANTLIANVETSSNPQKALNAYQNYLVKNLPVIYQPEQDYQLSEIKSTLKGASPQSPYQYLLPENWYFTK
jgi:peptide/nickel transport system substrate-binding protein